MSLQTMIAWNIAVASALAVVVLLAGILPMVRNRPALRHCLWLLVLVKLVTPPLIPLPVLLERPIVEVVPQSDQLEHVTTNEVASVESQSDPAKASDDAALLAPTNDSWEQTAASPNKASVVVAAAQSLSEKSARSYWDFQSVQPFFPTACLLSLIVTMLLTVRGMWRIRSVSRLLRRADWENKRLSRATNHAAIAMGVKRDVQTCVVSAVVTPFLWVRAGQPIIVLPKDLVERLTDKELDCILRHELAHFIRLDHLSNTFVFLVGALFWWNPIVWWARREMRVAQESCCDAIVVEKSPSLRRTYAETLLHVIEFIGSERPMLPVLVSSFGEASSVKRRFKMLANLGVRHQLSWSSRLVVLCVVAMTVCYPMYAQTDAADDGVALDQGASSEPETPVDDGQQDLEATHAGQDAVAEARKALQARRDELKKQLEAQQQRVLELVEAQKKQLAATENRFKSALARELLNRYTGEFRGKITNRSKGVSEDYTVFARWRPGNRFLELQVGDVLTIVTFNESEQEFRSWEFKGSGESGELRGKLEASDSSEVAIRWTGESVTGESITSRWVFPANDVDTIRGTTTITNPNGKVIYDAESTERRVTSRGSAVGPAPQADPYTPLSDTRNGFDAPTSDSYFAPGPEFRAALETVAPDDVSDLTPIVPADSEAHVIVNLDPNGSIKIGDKVTTIEGLKKHLADELKRDKNISVRLRCDRRTSHRHVAKVADVCRAVGVPRFEITVHDKKEPVVPTPDDAKPKGSLIYKRASESVVTIRCEKHDHAGDDDVPQLVQQAGMGTIIDQRGYIITTDTVIGGAKNITVTLSDGRVMPGRFVAQDTDADIAIIKVDANSPLRAIPFADSSAIMPGNFVTSIGSAYGFERTLTKGIVSAIDRTVQIDGTKAYSLLIQTDANILPGSAGGPLLNDKGELIGINVAIRVGAKSVGFAVPSNSAIAAAERMIATDR